MAATLHSFDSRPTPDQLAALRSLASAAAGVDGHPPFNDQTWAALRAGDHGVRGLYLLPDGGALQSGADGAGAGDGAGASAWAAAAVLTDLDEPADGSTDDGSASGVLAELVVHPDLRRQGLGGTLADGVVDAVPAPRTLEAWSHGGHPAAARLAARHGLSVTRELWVMALDPEAVASLPEPTLPAGVDLTTFRVGTDESAWLEVNAAAFDFHPEQGKMTLGDLRAREAEDWFDAEGFLLAKTEDGRLRGFHWTKITRDAAGVPSEGEVYAVGIAPDAQGSGLGRALTTAGLRYLARAGVPRIVLYVEADNTPAVNLYRSLGFTLADSDVLYAR